MKSAIFMTYAIAMMLSGCGPSSKPVPPFALLPPSVPSPIVVPPVTGATTVELTLAPAPKAISPLLVGSNVWYNPTHKVWDLSRDGGIKIYRIGGHAYDVSMPLNEQLLDMVKKAEAGGAEILMQASQYQTPAQAAALVKYFNIEKHGNKPILRWSIGNEPWLQANRPSQAVISAQIEAYWKPIAAALKEIDPSIKI